MSSNEGAKARRKAFKMAAWIQSPDEPADVVTRVYQDAWKAIWKRALRYADQVHQEGLAQVERHLTAARTSAQLLNQDVASLEASVAAKDADIKRLTSNLEQVTETAKNRLARIDDLEQALTILEKVADNNDLRDQVAALMADQVGGEEELAKLQEQVKQLTAKRDQLLKFLAEEKTLTGDLKCMNKILDDRNVQLSQQLEETKKHTTSATWKVFEENERLIAEVNDLRDRLAAATEPKRSCGAILQEGHTHRCSKYEHHKGGTHACELCGRTWFAIR